MSDDNKDDFSDVEEWINSDDEDDLISSDEFSEEESEEDVDESDVESEYLEEEEEADPEAQGSVPEEEEYEFEQEVPNGEEHTEQSGGPNKQAIIALGLVGVTIVGLGAAGYNYFSGGAPAPQPAPAFSAGGTSSSIKEEPPEDDQFGTLLGEEVNASESETPDPGIDESSFEDDPFADVGSDIEFESYSGSTEVVEQAQPPKPVTQVQDDNEMTVQAVDGRFEKTMEEYSKEANLVGSDALDSAINSVRSYVDQRFETALSERKAIRASIEESKAKDRQQDLRVASLESEIKGLRGEIMQALAAADKRMAAMESRKPAAGQPREAIDASTMPGLSDRERLPGFQILATSNGGTMAITKTPSSKVQVFFEGEHMVIRGHGVMKVTGLRADGRVVLVGDKYFFDETYKRPEPQAVKPKPANSKPKAKASKKPVVQEKASTPKTVTKNQAEKDEPEYVIAEKNPNDVAAQKRSYSDGSIGEKTAIIREESPSSSLDSKGKQLAEGWKVVGSDTNKSSFLVRSPAGRWHPVKVGQTIPEVGEVEGMDANGNLLVGEYIIIGK